ncbi:MAG TPA: carbohydrate ABC transporter permease [Candidatus Binatia bacterium]|nr:carbohydrate ABC transporter permease [Candidatus Binatia bacterium]
MERVTLLARVPARRRPSIRLPWRQVLAAFVALPFAVPFLWLVASVLKPPGEFYAAPPALLPANPSLENIAGVARLVDVPRLFLNTTLVAVITAVGSVLSSALVGFAFATLEARGARVLFAILIGTILIPPAALIVPQFVVFSRLGWVDTYLPLLVPALLGNAFFVFLFRQWFRSLPPHLFEQAELDGADPLQAFRHIALPLAKPALAAVAVFAFVGAWNDFPGPVVYLRDPDSFTLSLGLASFQGLYVNQLHHTIALAGLALVPPVVLFLLAQRVLVRGVSTAGWRT